ncbi:MAG: hypothetical protein ABIL09_10615 [Gemmatimonadota bacterium]
MSDRIARLRKPRRRTYRGSVEPYFAEYGLFDSTYFAGAFVGPDTSGLQILQETEMKANWAEGGAALYDVVGRAETAGTLLARSVNSICTAVSDAISAACSYTKSIATSNSGIPSDCDRYVH